MRPETLEITMTSARRISFDGGNTHETFERGADYSVTRAQHDILRPWCLTGKAAEAYKAEAAAKKPDAKPVKKKTTKTKEA